MEKKTKIIVAGISFVGINLSTLLTATVAWFNANRTVSASGMVVSSRNEQNVDILAKHIYTWDYQHDEPIETTDMNLEPYDCFITTRNVYARKFLKLTLQYPNGVPANTYLSLTVDCRGPLFDVNNPEYVDTNISNLIQFKFYDNIAGGIDETSVATIYNSCKTVFNGISNMSKFVILTNNGDDVTGSKPTNSIEDHSIPLAQSSNVGAYTTDLYIEYTYNTDLIAYYQANAEATFDLTVFTGSQEITFSSDIWRIIIDTHTSI